MNAYIFAGLRKDDVTELKLKKSTLLQNIEDVIKSNGGRYRLAEKIENEWMKYTVKLPSQKTVRHTWTEEEDKYLVENYKRFQDWQLANRLNTSKGDISRRLGFFYTIGLPRRFK